MSAAIAVRRRFGFTHAEVSACLASQWGVEDIAVEAILGHHAPQSEATELLALADWIAHRSDETQEDTAPPVSRLTEAECAALCEVVRERFHAEARLFA